MQIHNIKRQHPLITSQTVGRGGKRGKTSGRGTKGQKARSGRKIRPEIRDMIKRIPKLRGRGKNSNLSFQVKAVPVNVKTLEKAFNAGDAVTPETLKAKGIISFSSGVLPKVKILGSGELTKKLNISLCAVSASAKAIIEKAGGTVK